MYYVEIAFELGTYIVSIDLPDNEVNLENLF